MQNEDLPLLDRLYINDGKGNFSKSNSLPLLYGNKSVAVTADVDHDGDMDLFVGGRVVAGKYGEIPDSYLFLNDGKGNFTVAPESTSPGLRKIGMVTDAVWTDMDKDGWLDLVIAGEWMPVTVYKNEQGKLVNNTTALGFLNTTGLWATIHVGDINNDGMDDLLVGNWGENSKLHASAQYPLKLFTGDLDNNGALDQLLAIEKKGRYYTFLGKADLEKQLPALMRKKYENYSGFAGQTIEEVFGGKLEHTKKFSAATLSSVMLLNNGENRLPASPAHSHVTGETGQVNYTLFKLPVQVQWSPVFAFFTGDFNGDYKTDIITAGNFYGVLPYEGRYDAGYDAVLLGKHSVGFDMLSPYQSGLMVTGEVRDIKRIKLAGGRQCLIIARNNDTPVFLTW